MSVNHIIKKTLHVSVIIIWPPSGVVLRASVITTFSACLLRLSGMWLYVVYVCVSGNHLIIAHSDLCTLQLSPLYYREEDIEECSRNIYFCMV